LGITGGIIAGYLAGILAHIKKRFKELEAFSEETAVTFEELNLPKDEMSTFEDLIKRGVIKRTKDGKVWWKG
jgi:hypothetical protein